MTLPKPNVIFILSDDMSWADMGCFGQTKIETPHLDALCTGGVRFNACYAGAPLCAPSRSCLMQGRHLGHATVRENMVRDGDAVYRHCLQADDTTVAHIFKQAGYATGMFGKWGLALHNQTGQPNDMGFDEFFGYLNQRKAHSYYPPYLWHNTERIDLPENVGHLHREPNEYKADGTTLVNGVKDPLAASYSFDLCEEKSLAFVRRHKDDPFFLYLPVTIPHGALEAPSLLQYNDRDWPLLHKIYAAMVTRLDDAVGRLVEMLHELNIYDNTLIIFASDNGYSFKNKADDEDGVTLAEFFDHTGPYKGTKGNLNQGGLRVPAFAHWSGHIEAGSVSNAPWAFYDFLPSMCGLLEQPLPDGVDGVNVLPTWTGCGEQQDREYFYWQFNDEQAARLDDLYIYRRTPSAPIEIYHVDDDPQQETDLAGANPDLVARAAAIFDREHTPTVFFPSPGESREAWSARLHASGQELDHNVNT